MWVPDVLDPVPTPALREKNKNVKHKKIIDLPKTLTRRINKYLMVLVFLHNGLSVCSALQKTWSEHIALTLGCIHDVKVARNTLFYYARETGCKSTSGNGR